MSIFTITRNEDDKKKVRVSNIPCYTTFYGSIDNYLGIYLVTNFTLYCISSISIGHWSERHVFEDLMVEGYKPVEVEVNWKEKV